MSIFPISSKRFYEEAQRLDTKINEEHSSILERVAEIAEELRAYRESFESLKAQTDSYKRELDSQMSALNSQFEQKNSDLLSAFESGQTKTEENLNTRIGQISSDLDSCRKKLDDQISALNSQFEQKNSDLLSTLESRRKMLDDQISALNSQFEQKNSDLRGTLESRLAKVEDMLIKADSDAKRLDQKLSDISKHLEMSRQELDRLVGRFSQSIRFIPYRSMLERDFYSTAFGKDIFHSPDYPDKVLELIKGLDTESKTTVIKCLNKLQKVLESDPSKPVLLNLFSSEEQQELNRRVEILANEKLKLSDSMYYFRGYILPADNFEEGIFFENHGLDNISNIGVLRNKDIIDVGAFIGDSCLMLSPLTDKKVYSFEASTGNYELMLKTIEMNSLKNIQAINMAVSSESGAEIEINLSDWISTCGIKKNSGINYTGKQTVRTITLDDYVEENNLDVGLIKVDIEGAEQDFLKGAMKTIQKFKPILMISIYHNSSDFFDIKPMLEKLGLGYKFKIFRPLLSKFVMFETMLLAEISDQ